MTKLNTIAALQDKIAKVCESKFIEGELQLFGGDYDVYVEPTITTQGIKLKVNAHGQDSETVLLTWGELSMFIGDDR